MRYYRPTSLPQTINHELIQAELAALGNIGVSKDSQGWRVDVFDESITNDAIQAVIDAHDGTQKTARQQIEEADASAKQALLDLVDVALTQISNDTDTLNGSPTNADVIQVLLRILNREEKEVKALRALIRRV